MYTQNIIGEKVDLLMGGENKKLTIGERLRNGEKIVCGNCGKGNYITDAKDISTSHCFYCESCCSMINIDPCIDIE